MDDPVFSPEQFEVLVVRELRKAGLEVTEVRVIRWIRASDETGEFDVDLTARLRGAGEEHPVLIGCLHRNAPIGRDQVQRVGERSHQAGSRRALLFATSEYDRDALAYARDHGIALVRVVDGRIAHDTGGWGVRDHYPTWLPERMAQVVMLDEAGIAVTRLLAANQPRLILDRLGGAGPRV